MRAIASRASRFIALSGAGSNTRVISNGLGRSSGQRRGARSSRQLCAFNRGLMAEPSLRIDGQNSRRYRRESGTKGTTIAGAWGNGVTAVEPFAVPHIVQVGAGTRDPRRPVAVRIPKTAPSVAAAERPGFAQNRLVHAPAARMTVSQAMVPRSVTTALILPEDRSIPRTAQCARMTAPMRCAARAIAGAAFCGSAQPSVGTCRPQR